MKIMTNDRIFIVSKEKMSQMEQLASNKYQSVNKGHDFKEGPSQNRNEKMRLYWHWLFACVYVLKDRPIDKNETE